MLSMNDITLPKELAESNLTLEEIGSIFVFYSLPKIGEKSQSFWSTNERMGEVGKDLTKKGIIMFSRDENGDNIMEIDLSNVESLEKEFWEFYDYDENDNTIFAHPSYYGDEDSVYHYILTPSLQGDKILWELKHEEYGIIESYLETKEEAEYLARQELKRELEQLKKELDE